MLYLPDEQMPADICFSRVKAADIKAVVVEAMDDDFVLGKEGKQAGVQVNFAKQVKVTDILNWDGLALDLPIVSFLLKVDCVLPSLQPSASEDVVSLRHQASHLVKVFRKISPALFSIKQTKASFWHGAAHKSFKTDSGWDDALTKQLPEQIQHAQLIESDQ